MKRIVLESPFSGDRERNVAYAKAALRDSLARGEAPFASHLLYPRVLDDDIDAERVLWGTAGHRWIPVADFVAVYADRGISTGMQRGISVARHHNVPVELRRLYEVEEGDAW